MAFDFETWPWVNREVFEVSTGCHILADPCAYGMYVCLDLSDGHVYILGTPPMHSG